MAYIQGNLNQKVRLKDYKGLTSETAKVKVDDDNNTIEVDVIGMPSGCFPLPKIPDDAKNGEIVTVNNKRWKLTDIKAALPKFTKRDKNSILGIDEDGVELEWKKLDLEFIKDVTSLPTSNANTNIIYHKDGNYYIYHGDGNWFELANHDTVECLIRNYTLLSQNVLTNITKIVKINLTHTETGEYVIECDTPITDIFEFAKNCTKCVFKCSIEDADNISYCDGSLKLISMNKTSSNIMFKLGAFNLVIWAMSVNGVEQWGVTKRE